MTGLDRLLSEIRDCRQCIEQPAGAPLPHQPRPVLRAGARARLAICGQAPGTRVHATGIPFTDPSGDRLRDWMGVTAAEFYDESRIAIVPMGFCFPGLDAKGGDRRPRPECAPLWRGKVFAQLPELQLMLLVGAYAQKWHLPGCEDSLTQTVAAWRQILDRPGPPSMIPLPHPSWRNNGWLRNNPWFSCELLPELRRRVRNTLENE